MAILMTSCDGIIGYAIHTQKIDNHNRRYNINDEVEDDTIHFVLNKVRRQMLMKAEVNGVEDTVLYDSGAGMAAMQFYTNETKPKGMKFYRVPITGADKGTKVRMTSIPVQIKTPMCLVEHLGNAMLVPENRSCEKEPNISDYTIIGFSGLDMSRYAIDFTKNQIYCIGDMSVIDTTEYIPVKCRKDDQLNVMFVYPVINGVEYECIFDTGNGNGILIHDAQRVENHGDDMLYEGSYGKAIGGVTDMQRFVVAPETKVEFAGREETVPVMFLEGNLAFNNVGLQYIKKFDWIIEHRYNKVNVDADEIIHRMYARPHVADTMGVTQVRYSISTADGTLKILTRLIDGNEKFKVGDQIISVNGEKINEENICYYYDLLTENKDWSEFDVKVK